MTSTDRPEQIPDNGVASDAKPACVALVPTVATAQWSQLSSHQVSRSSSTFVAHLIATAEHVPQTRSLRRATPADAQNAYSATGYRSKGAGLRTRQTI